MRHKPIPSTLFVDNRKRFAAMMKQSSVAVFHSSDMTPSSADAHLPFKQHSDIYYATGIYQEETILLLCPDAPIESQREILFVRETNEMLAVWEGEKYSKEKAREISGVQNIQWLSAFDSLFRKIALQCDNIYLNTNEYTSPLSPVQTRDDRFRESCKQQFPLHNYLRSAPILHRLRMIKSEEEIACLSHACDITEKGFRQVLKFVKPDVWEYEIEAEFIYEFIRNGSRGFAYRPIIASGADSCVLHYEKNDKQCSNGDIICIDVGAEYAGYNADMTRSIPVNGQFSKRQREVYDAVLRVLRFACKTIKPGVLFKDYNEKIGEAMTEELLRLKLLKKSDVKKQNPEKPLYKRFFMHGTSHHLGLDVHDYHSLDAAMDKGMVLTVEPGIYIREEGLGIRLENDVVVTENGIVDLMDSIPIEAEEIEYLMSKGRRKTKK